MEEVRKEGDKRLQQSIPPVSRKDVKKKPDPYGDLIGWFQIIDYAKENKRSVILITNDKDWYVQQQGVTHPHPQLIKEMHDNAGVSSYIYKTDKFLKYARDYLDSKVSNETIEEAENRATYIAEQEFVKERSQRDNSALGRTRPDVLGIPSLLTQGSYGLGALLDDVAPSISDVMKISTPSISDVVSGLTPSASDLIMNPILEERQRRTDAMLNSIAERYQRQVAARMKPIFEEQQRRADAFWEQQQRQFDKNMKRYLK